MRRCPVALRYVTLTTAVVVVAACGSGGDVRFQGEDVQNAEELLEQADAAFTAAVDAEVDAATTTVSDESRCYFLRVDDDNVGPDLYCGPVRVLGADDDASWYAFATGAAGGGEELTLQLVPDEEPTLSAADTGRLFRPDGAEPADVSALEEPQAPPAPFSDTAVLTAAAGVQLPVELTPLDEPYRLITPSATLTVEAAAQLETVPADLLDLTGTDAGTGGADDGEQAEPPAFYRPADGQQVRAWRVTIGPPPEIGPALDRNIFTGQAEGRDASTTYAVGAGSQRLSVAGDLTGDDGGTARVECEEVQCDELDQVQYILIASGAADTPLSLIATVDGTDQALDLDTGELTSDVTQVSYTREESFQQVSTTWGTQTYRVAEDEEICDFCDPVDYRYGGSVQRVYLAPFAAMKGWAPPGKAWLLIPVDDDPDSLEDEYVGSSTFAESRVDSTESWTLETDGEEISHDPDATIGHTAAFLVDDTFAEGTFTYLPTGSIVYTDPDRTDAFEAEEPLTLDIAFP